jgi:metal-responsive CopG/Arc/MetJ family transcriptional regulator
MASHLMLLAASDREPEELMSTTRTTLALPAELLAAVDEAVRAGKASSRNEFVARALRRLLVEQERARIDAEFAAMAHDADYLAEAEQIAEEFAAADWEALQISEGQQ